MEARHTTRATAGDDAVTIPHRTSAAESTSPTASSPAEALFLEEAARIRLYALFSVFMYLGALIGVPFLGGDRTLRTIFIIELAIDLVYATVLYLRLRDPARYRPSQIVVPAIMATVTAYTLVLYWGIHSPATAMVAVGIYFFNRSQSLGAALLIYGLCAATQAVMAALILSGAVADPGMYTAEDRPLVVNLVTQGMIQFTFLLAHVLARFGRAATLRVIDGLLQVHREADRREAALQEINQDLHRMAHLGAAGHHTDRQVGAYRLGAVIGRGAMGEVYEAVHMASGERAAIKLLHANVLAHPGSVARFLREAAAASALESPHVVRVLDAGTAAAPLPYLAMELLSGHDLAHHLRVRRRLSVESLDKLVREVGHAVDEAGSKGIVHRDLKPHNLFLAERPGAAPIWKVLDFGASKLAQHSGTLTEGRVLGTPAYMPPEQSRGEEATPAADRYALAAIAYRCLTGRPPFTGKDLPSVLYAVCFTMPPRPSVLVNVPQAVDHVLAVALAKSPGARFASAAEFADALSAALAGLRDDWIERRAEALLIELPWGDDPAARPRA